MGSTQVIVFDDSALYRAAYVAMLERAGYFVTDWKVPADGTGACAAVVGVRDRTALDRVSCLQEHYPRLPVVAVTPTRSVEVAVEALRLGARAIVALDDDDACLVEAVACAVRGAGQLPSSVLDHLVRQGGRTRVLAPRDVDWLVRLDSGATIHELAKDAGYSERSMYRLLNSLYQRVGATSRTEAIATARRRGLLS